MMKKGMALAATLAVSVLAGCDILAGILLPSTVTLSLVNDSPDFNVVATISYAEDEDILEEVLTTLGTEREYTIQPGDTVTRTFDCDEFGAFILDDAELQATILRPDTSTGVLRQDEDFRCGQEVILTFTHSEVLTDFAVSVDTRSTTPGS